MKKRKIIAIVTILTGLPGLLGILTFGAISPLLILIAVAIRGFCGVFGGIYVWKGKKLGYQLSLVMWGYLLAVSVYNIYQVYTGNNLYILLDESYKLKTLANSLGKLIWGIPIVIILIQDLLRQQKTNT